jgi:hypothetical protein
LFSLDFSFKRTFGTTFSDQRLTLHTLPNALSITLNLPKLKALDTRLLTLLTSRPI